MLPLLAALTFQVSSRPVWAVADLCDLKDPQSAFGRSASDALAAELAKSGAYEIIPRERVDVAAVALDIHGPPLSLVERSRVGQAFRASTIVSGEVVDYRLDPGGPAQVAVRVVAYDVASVLPANGALEIGKADLHGNDGKSLVREEIARAVASALTTMRYRRTSMASILNTGQRTTVIDRGTREGFRKGMRVFVMAGARVIGLGRVEKIEESRVDRSRRTRDGLVTGQARPCHLRPAAASTR